MNLEHWKQFESTGRIEDYLNFVSCERQEENRETGGNFSPDWNKTAPEGTMDGKARWE